MGPTNGGAYWIERRPTSTEKLGASPASRRRARERCGRAPVWVEAGAGAASVTNS